jgi:hypothetical protein
MLIQEKFNKNKDNSVLIAVDVWLYARPTVLEDFDLAPNFMVRQWDFGWSDWGWVKREKDLWQLDAEVKVMQLVEMIGPLMQIEVSLEKIKDGYEHPNKLAGS